MLKSLRAKVFLVFGMFFCLMIVSFGMTYNAVKKESANRKMINLAGAQRMLSQKMAKEAFEASTGNEDARRSLEQTASRFDLVLKGLLNGDDKLELLKVESPEVRSKLEAVHKQWIPFKEKVGIIAGSEGGKYQEALSFVADNNGKLLDEMNKAVKLMEEWGVDGLTINLAGAQRMLSQKVTKEVLLVGQGDTDAVSLARASVDRFDAVLKGLINGDTNLGLQPATIPAIKQQLQVVSGLWGPFKEQTLVILGQEGQQQREALNYIIDNNPGLLKDMNDAVVAMEAGSEGRMLILQVVILILGLIIIMLGLFLMNRWVTKPINLIEGVVERISKGDLTHTTGIRGQDEIGRLGANFDLMVTNLKKLLFQVQDASNRVAASSAQLSSAADHVAQTSSQVTLAVQQVANGAVEQTESVQETVAVMNELRQTINQIARGAHTQAQSANETSAIIKQIAEAIDQVAYTAQGVLEAANQALAVAEDGGSAVEKTIRGMERIRQTAMEASTRVRELGQQSQQIGEIVSLISDIADQTNLLALNAAIEAARAGEHGKGFAVVAEEVRKLAERSSRATKDIADLINNVQMGVEAAVSSMDAGTQEVEKGAELASGVGSVLEDILQAMRRTNGYAQEISAAAEQVAAGVGDAVAAIDNVARVTEENSAATEQMAASSTQITNSVEAVAAVSKETAESSSEVSVATQEMNASAEQISATAQSLAGMAKELQAMIGNFKL